MPRSHKEGALSRWSRRKLESTGVATEPEESAEQTAVNQESVSGDPREAEPRRRTDEALIELPPIDELGPDSDFQGFMDPQVDDSLRRAALKKLFRDPHFNVTDGLDVYAEDYTKLESMTPAMVAGLKHARGLLFGDVDGDKQADTTRAADSLAGTGTDEASKAATLVANEEEDREPGDSEPGSSNEDDGDFEGGVRAIPSPGEGKVKV